MPRQTQNGELGGEGMTLGDKRMACIGSDHSLLLGEIIGGKD